MRIIMINLNYHPSNQVKCPIGKLLAFFIQKTRYSSQFVGSGSSAPIPDLKKVLNIMLRLILF